jgi:N-acetylglutamate synthase-like GNAT family acetyltransferase
VSLREGEPADAPGIVRLVEANLEAGHLLPRSVENVSQHASRFFVLDHEGEVVGCCELAPLSRAVAEVRSLVVDAAWRGKGLGTSLLEELRARARRGGFTVLSAFTHDPHRFIQLGFSIVPHVWFPEKVSLDCTGCARFRTCGQQAMALALTPAGALPTVRPLREPVTAASPAVKQAALPPVRLRVIA